jgi:hypothetical protein
MDLVDVVGKPAASLPQEARQIPAPHLRARLKAAARQHAAEALRPAN